MHKAILTAVGFVLLCAPAAQGQSLADVARQEAERRKTIAVPGKVYTNDSLRTEPQPSTPPAAAPAPSAPPAETPAAPAAGAPEATPPTEADWRKKVAAARDSLTRLQTFSEALQSRINALTADFVNRDDPAQRNVVAADREKSLAELERVTQDIAQQQKALAALQEEARRTGVPAGWVR
jgi:gas vesicle protein